MLKSLATFSEVHPMGCIASAARGCDDTLPLMSPGPLSGERDMDSAPSARPQSIDPALILSATAFTAINPELQKRFRDMVDVVAGNPAARHAIRTLYAEPGSRTFPRTISSISSGLILDSPSTP